jgi:hypothetical protein
VRFRSLPAAGLALTAVVGLAGVAPIQASAHVPSHRVKHVLVLSVDGLHQSDLAWYVSTHRQSALAALVTGGADFRAAQTTFPSDSFPGMVAQFTGAGPGSSGVYYDDTYNRSLMPAGTLDCSTAKIGTEVAWTEAADRSQNPITLDAGQQLTGRALGALPTNTRQQTLDSRSALTSQILHLTPNAAALLDPAALPVDPATCLPVYPHSYLRTNTVFEVVRQAGLRTAWSDKHPAYEILSGPSGTGVQDLFTPEINSVADSTGDDWTTDNALTQEYDSFKVAAVLNQLDGYDHSRTTKVGTPAILGMNFQTVSTAQKLPVSDGLRGGYNPDGTPGPLLRQALDYIDSQVSALRNRVQADDLAGSTTVILSAKHGQSPIDPNALRRVDDGAIIGAINAGWAASHPGAAALVAFSVDDDGMLLWLSDRSATAEKYAKSYLLTHPAPANTINDAKGVFSTSVTASGLSKVYIGAAADKLVSAYRNDPHAPDLIGIARHGVVYTGGVKKIAEHGGAAADDRDVALVVSGTGVRPSSSNRVVQTTQIAPTILRLLGLDPQRLQAVRTDHVSSLPLW